MKLQLAERKQAKMKMALQGPSGSGKTMGALLLAYGLCKDWSKIAVIDTENYSASLYAHLGKYSVVNITAPFTPEKYIDAINLCIEAGFEVVIIDSISHEWEGSGGILDIHSSMTGNSFTNWSKITPRHNAFIQAFLQAPVHIIATIRTKQDYVLSEKNGKQVPEKVGLKGITRDGLDYDCTLLFDVDIKHNAVASKDRTGLFMDKPEQKITVTMGEQLLEWCNNGLPASPDEQFIRRIHSCRTYNELKDLYYSNPEYQTKLVNEFNAKKKEFSIQAQPANSITSNYKANGSITHQ